MKNLTAVIALLAVFTLAICFILNGSISEEIKVVLGIDDSQLGTLASTLFLTCLAVHLFIGVLVDKFGHKVLALAGFFITSGAIFLLAFAGSFALALGACALLGVGAMCVNRVVFGLGRGPGTRPLFRGPGQRISVGFVESSQPLQAHEQVARAVTDAIGARTVHPYYDRALSFGDRSWTNYDALVRLTIHGFTPSQIGAPTYDVTHFGVALRWRGHTADGRQPSRQWFPLGAQGELLLRVDSEQCRWRVLPGPDSGLPITQAAEPSSVLLGQPIRVRAQVQTLADGRSRYRFKHGPDDAPEPVAWAVETFKPDGTEFPSGSLCLVPHNSDVTFHEVDVRPLPSPAVIIAVVHATGAHAFAEEQERSRDLTQWYPQPAASREADEIPWQSLKNPVLGREDWAIKDQGMIEKDGWFYLFASAFYAADGDIRSHIVSFKTRDFVAWSEPLLNFYGKDKGFNGFAAPTVHQFGDRYVLIFNRWSTPRLTQQNPSPEGANMLFYMESEDLEQWSPLKPMATKLEAYGHFPVYPMFDRALA